MFDGRRSYPRRAPGLLPGLRLEASRMAQAPNADGALGALRRAKLRMVVFASELMRAASACEPAFRPDGSLVTIRLGAGETEDSPIASKAHRSLSTPALQRRRNRRDHDRDREDPSAFRAAPLCRHCRCEQQDRPEGCAGHLRVMQPRSSLLCLESR